MSAVDNVLTSFHCISSDTSLLQAKHSIYCHNWNSFLYPASSANRQRKWRVYVVVRARKLVRPLIDKSIPIIRGVSSKLNVKILTESDDHAADTSAIVAKQPTFHSKLPREVPISSILLFGAVFLAVVLAMKRILNFQSKVDDQGSVSDLVRRGQLRSDRRKISQPLKYDDPFNNPLVKVNEKASTMKMCGKVYQLAPVTLTEDKVLSHQNRRMRAYRWKRPTMFLKEGDPLPPGVDPDTVRWVPANHPFATASNDIDESSAQKNIYQKRGIPSRIRAEHEKLQKNMMMRASENSDPVIWDLQKQKAILRSASTNAQLV
eukprot:TRINITY_DN4116_c0_g1_i1.p1 TRINITY_DN4116_c0_g1~~TRINITY_DN4116_c0_g1_i1.p1  ORF type:complete len:319 (-),score=43.58 TRINITY_DN4116_c0_g1_i1:182-1138(-)